MFERQFGLRENPFAAGHQSRFVYPSREHQEALAHLRFGIENREPFVLITGEVGTGKTTALYDVLAEYESRAVVALITNSSLTRDELLEEICLRFGLAPAGRVTKPQALAALERFLRETRANGHRAILILDEAQNLERELLEEIRLLSNLEDQGEKLLQLFLVGQPELEEKLARAELRQLRQRITVFYRLSPLNQEDTERYIHHRIAVAGGHAISLFPADACHEVYRITHGIPREINTVAGQSMLNAYVEDSPAVLPEHVRMVERDSEFQSVLRGKTKGARISTLEAAPEAAEPGPPTGASASPPPRPPVPARAAQQQPAAHPAAFEAAAAPAARPEPPAIAHSAPAPAPAAAPPIKTPVPAAQPPAAVGPPVAPDASLPRLHSPEASAPPSRPPAAAQPSGPAPVAESQPPRSTPAGDAPAGALVGSSPGSPPRTAPVTPAGSAEAWGFWLSSLAESSAEPPKLETERLAGPVETGGERAKMTPAVEPAAGAAAPTRSEVATRARATARAENAGDTEAGARAAADAAAHRARAPRRLEFVEDEPPVDRAKNRRVLIGLGVLVVVATAGVLITRPGPLRLTGARSKSVPAVSGATAGAGTSAPGSPAPSATTPAPAPASVRPPAPSSAQPPRTNALLPPATAPAPVSAATGPESPAFTQAQMPMIRVAQTPTTPEQRPAAPSGAAPTRPRAAPHGVFGLAVGTYLNEERAEEVRGKLVESTQLPSLVLMVTENDVAMYRLIMGAFENRRSAERAASSLIERGLVDEARVVSLADEESPKP